MPFSTSCRLCGKKFRTGTSLTKHFDLKHPRSTLGRARFEDAAGFNVEEPKEATLGSEEKEEYLKWLSILVERINSSLGPDHPGK